MHLFVNVADEMPGSRVTELCACINLQALPPTAFSQENLVSDKSCPEQSS